MHFNEFGAYFLMKQQTFCSIIKILFSGLTRQEKNNKIKYNCVNFQSGLLLQAESFVSIV